MNVREKERMQEKPFWLFIFLQTVTMTGKDRPEEQWGRGVTRSSECDFWSSMTPIYFQREELLQFSSTPTASPSHLSTIFKSHVLEPGYHGHAWALKTLMLLSGFLGVGIARSKCAMWEKHDLAPGEPYTEIPPYCTADQLGGNRYVAWTCRAWVSSSTKFTSPTFM